MTAVETEHPTWCDREACTATPEPPFGAHTSRKLVALTGPHGRTATYLDRAGYRAAPTLLVLELVDEISDAGLSEPSFVAVYRLEQARVLHARIGRLLRLARSEW